MIGLLKGQWLMFEFYQYKRFIKSRIRNIVRRIFLVLIVLVKVTVLFFIIATPGAVHANEKSRLDMHLFEFTSESYMLMGLGRLYGLMASNDSRQRIAIYWIEPPVYHDSSFFLGYSDFIFEKDVVHYWINGAPKSAIFDLSNNKSDTLLPRDTLTESVARSALAIVYRIKSQSEQSDTPLEVGKFFRQSRNWADYSYEVPLDQVGGDLLSDSNVPDVQILNNLPYGRKYSKETRSDGTIVWCAQRELDVPHVARVTVKPVAIAQVDGSENMFDPNSLGQWILVPEAYRAYWSFDKAYSDLKDEIDDTVTSRKLRVMPSSA
jgi:hypothetical protein